MYQILNALPLGNDIQRNRVVVRLTEMRFTYHETSNGGRK